MKKNSKNNYYNFAADGPVLDKINVNFDAQVNFDTHPFSLPLIKNLTTIHFPTQVTFFVGENGAGKSTILEAIACKAGFGLEGGSMNINFTTSQSQTYAASQSLASQLIFSWRVQPRDGYFFRAESFFNLANYLDTTALNSGKKAYEPYGGKSLHEQSHGESFMAFFENRLGDHGFFILDEPEAALSAQRQLSLLVIMHELCKNSKTQFIIATHSPILLAYPGATIYSCDSDTLTQIAYKDTQHYQITKQFLDNPENFLHHLLEE